MKFWTTVGVVVGAGAAVVNGQGQPCVTSPFIKVQLIENDLSSEATSTYVSETLQDAADRWNVVLQGNELTDVRMNRQANLENICGDGAVLNDGELIDNLLIFARIRDIDGEGNKIAESKGCVFSIKGNTLFPRIGSMTLDSTDVQRMIEGGTLFGMIMHEMGHVLGIGSERWQARVKNIGAANPTYEGANAQNGVDGFKAIGGQGNAVPVEDTGAATRDTHWRQSVFSNELMSGFITGAKQPLSAMTIGSLKDLGYTVDESKADAFQIAGQAPSPPPAQNPPTPNCRNVADAPQFGPGTQFITGPCQRSNDCASGCCEIRQKICRASLSLESGQQFCEGSGFTPVFAGAPCGSPTVTPPPVPDNLPPPANCRNVDQAPQPNESGTFVTAPCRTSADCKTNCCELNKKTCRNPLALGKTEFCDTSLFSPIFDPPCSGRRLRKDEPAFAPLLLEHNHHEHRELAEGQWEVVDHVDVSKEAPVLGPDGVFTAATEGLGGLASSGEPESSSNAGLIVGCLFGGSIATLLAITVYNKRKESEASVDSDNKDKSVGVKNPTYNNGYGNFY